MFRTVAASPINCNKELEHTNLSFHYFWRQDFINKIEKISYPQTIVAKKYISKYTKEIWNFVQYVMLNITPFTLTKGLLETSVLLSLYDRISALINLFDTVCYSLLKAS